MTPEQQAAFVYSQTACMLAELAAMQCANQGLGPYDMPYGTEDFRALPDKYGLGHNAVVGMFLNC